MARSLPFRSHPADVVRMDSSGHELQPIVTGEVLTGGVSHWGKSSLGADLHEAGFAPCRRICDHLAANELSSRRSCSPSRADSPRLTGSLGNGINDQFQSTQSRTPGRSATYVGPSFRDLEYTPPAKVETRERAVRKGPLREAMEHPSAEGFPVTGPNLRLAGTAVASCARR